MKKGKSAHSDRGIYVGTTHVPVSKGCDVPSYCVVVPETDVDDRARFLLWSRVYWADGIFKNNGWVARGRQHLERDLELIRRGDTATLASLLVECPPVATLPEVTTMISRALLRFEPELFGALAKGLVRKSKGYITKGMKRVGVHSLRVTQRMKEARGALAARGEELFSDAPFPSERSRIARAKGVERFEDSDEPRNVQQSLNRYKVLRQTYPRVVTLSLVCQHDAGLDVMCEGEDLPERQAPRLILGPEDEHDGSEGRSIVVIGDV